MDAPDLLTLGLTAHGAVALVVLGGGLPRYSERADVHGKAVQETEEREFPILVTVDLEWNTVVSQSCWS